LRFVFSDTRYDCVSLSNVMIREAGYRLESRTNDNIARDDLANQTKVPYVRARQNI